jgi:peptidoglycan-associated lipoprotein
VRKSLSLLGVPDSQMEAVSFGKEKPKAQGSNEAAWKENRRADIAY